MTDCATQPTKDGWMASGDLADKRIAIAHIAVIVVGGLILLANAFHSNIWFEESYSIAVAQSSFADIWSASSYDVHPILHYVVLYVLNILFGTNVMMFRLFSLMGIVVLSLLGFTHLRKDFGAVTSIMFSALAYFLPWSVYAAFQIRMYSWLAVAMTFIFVYAWRIGNAHASRAYSARECAIPLRWWVILFASSVITAYLHYYGAIAALVSHVFLIVILIRSKAPVKSYVKWAYGAVLSAVALIPFACIAVSQANCIDSNAFWSHFDYAKSSAKIFLFPFDSPELGNYTSLSFTSATGELPEEGDLKLSFNLTVEIIALTMAASCACIASVFSYGMKAGEDQADTSKRSTRTAVHPVVLPIAIMAAVCGVSSALSFLLFDQYLYYRFAAALIGPLAFVMAYAFGHTRKMQLGIIACTLCVVCGVVSYYSLFNLSHSEYNGAAHELYESMYNEAKDAFAGEEPLVLATSVTTGGMVAVSEPDVTVHYVSDAKDEQFRAFGPQLVDADAEVLLSDYHGSALVIGSLQDAEALANRFGGHVTSYHNALNVYANGYSNGWFDYSVVVFEEKHEEQPA